MTERLQDSTVGDTRSPEAEAKLIVGKKAQIYWMYSNTAHKQRNNKEQHAFKYHLIKDSRATRKAEHEHLKTSIIKQLENR